VSVTAKQEITVREALEKLLHAQGRHNRNDMVAPVAILWTDKARAWAPVIATLRSSLPILTLGNYQPNALTGPAIWLRCVVDGTLPEVVLPEGIPILYLPEVSRNDLRAIESCPKHLRPLAELQYRGVFFTQSSNRDWTPAAFLAQSKVKVAEDQATKAALQRALPRLLSESLSVLQPLSPLSADALNALLTPDPVQQLLVWLDDPAGTQRNLEALHDGSWASFIDVAKGRYGFDPVQDGELTAARLLGNPQGPREAAWRAVWARFAESPQRYPNLPALLRRAKPPQTGLFNTAPTWPQDNEDEEKRLRGALLALKGSLPTDAAREIGKLEAEHGSRRSWVWAELDQAPLAQALSPLLKLAQAVETPLGAGTPQEIAERYTQGGWQVDALALEVMGAGTSNADAEALQAALHAVYRPWLEVGARAFQDAVQQSGLPKPTPQAATSGRCWLFSDGLRFDVAQLLLTALEGDGLEASLDWQFSALPGVTNTAKPAVSPVAGQLSAGPEFQASYKGSKVTVDVLRRALRDSNFEVLQGNDTGDVMGSAWTESGNFDSLGHNRGWRLAQQVGNEVRLLSERIQALLAAGWQEVHIVTDHGWLLLPGGLDKLDLPQHLTETRKGRCARLKPGANTDQPTVPWHFDSDVQIAVAPGLGVYVSGQDYEHGGLSVQECVLPVLTVRADAEAVQTNLTVTSVRWTGMRCRVEVADAPEGATVDLRTRAADATTSVVAAAKALDAQGRASLVVPDDTREGDAAHLVVLSPTGQLLAQQGTTLGG
jgi:hypothetical protein